MTQGDEPVPHLRRDPNPSAANGRKVLIGVAVFFLLLVAFVLTLVFTIGIHNNGVKPPPPDVRLSTPSAASTSTAAPDASRTFFAVDADTGEDTFVGASSTYRAQRHPQRAVAAGADAVDRIGYFAVPIAGCRTRIESVTYLPHFRRVGLVRNADVAVIKGRVRPVPMQVSPDGTKLALVATPAAATGSKCVAQRVAYSFDLKSHAMRLGAGVVAGEPTSMAWAADSKSLDLLTGGTVTRQVVACGGCVPPLVARLPDADVVLFWHGELATVVDGAIRAVASSGLGATLATGLPESLTTISVDPTGTKLLMSAGPDNTEEPQGITWGTTYVWSDGRATALSSGHWIDPAW